MPYGYSSQDDEEYYSDPQADYDEAYADASMLGSEETLWKLHKAKKKLDAYKARQAAEEAFDPEEDIAHAKEVARDWVSYGITLGFYRKTWKYKGSIRSMYTIAQASGVEKKDKSTFPEGAVAVVNRSDGFPCYVYVGKWVGDLHGVPHFLFREAEDSSSKETREADFKSPKALAAPSRTPIKPPSIEIPPIPPQDYELPPIPYD